MEQLINFIIRPPRAEYTPKDDLLDLKFKLKGKWYQRRDLEIVNNRGDVLQCSHYMPVTRPEGNPCVIYCHGNSGCRTDSSEAAVILLPSNITVFAFDFSGSGLSGGEHVTLGWNEKADLKAVVDFLRTDRKVSLIGLWGRSMGAVTSLMYAAEDNSLAGMVLDSPFSDLVDLMMELVDSYKFRLPKFTVKLLILYIRKTIQKKAKFDITELNTIKAAKLCFVPALFGHALDDDFIRPHHSDLIFDAYAGDKNIIRFEGDHNSTRPRFYFDSISIFFNNVLQPPQDQPRRPALFNAAQARWAMLHDKLLGSSNDTTADSAEDDDAVEKLQAEKPVENRESDSSPSSSAVTGSDGPQGSGVPRSVHGKEDIRVLGPLQSSRNFPANVEDEERMIMEVVLESLKDLRQRYPSSNGRHCLHSGTSSDAVNPTDNTDAAHSMKDKTSVSTSGSNVASEDEKHAVGEDLPWCWDLFFQNR